MEVRPSGFARNMCEPFPLEAIESVLLVRDLEMAGGRGLIGVPATRPAEQPGRDTARLSQPLSGDE